MRRERVDRARSAAPAAARATGRRDRQRTPRTAGRWSFIATARGARRRHARSGSRATAPNDRRLADDRGTARPRRGARRRRPADDARRSSTASRCGSSNAMLDRGDDDDRRSSDRGGARRAAASPTGRRSSSPTRSASACIPRPTSAAATATCSAGQPVVGRRVARPIAAARRRTCPAARRSLGRSLHDDTLDTSLAPRRLADLPRCDADARRAVHERAADILRPIGALARLDEVAAWVAGWQRTSEPAVRKPAALIFAADHGVAAAGCQQVPDRRHRGDARRVPSGQVAPSPRSPRWPAHGRRRSMSASADPTGDIRYESAMSRDGSTQRRRGRRSTPSTSSTPTCSCSARWASATPRPPPPSRPRSAAARSRRGSAAAPASTTRGWPASGRRSARRSAASPACTDPLEVLREVGGAELVAMAAAIVAARHRSLAGAARRLRRHRRRRCRSAMIDADGARPLPRRPLLGRARPPPAARTARQAAAARPRHAPRRGQRRDGRRAAGRDGVRRHHRRPDVRRVVRLSDARRLPIGCGAVQFLTRVPDPRCAPTPIARGACAVVPGRRRARSEPRSAASPRQCSWHVVPPSVAAAVAVIVGRLLTGAFHEDGLADMADAFAGGWTPAATAARSSKDPRHGTYGVAALCSIDRAADRCASRARVPRPRSPVLVAAHTLGRGAAVARDGHADAPARTGLGADYGAFAVTSAGAIVGVVGGARDRRARHRLVGGAARPVAAALAPRCVGWRRARSAASPATCSARSSRSPSAWCLVVVSGLAHRGRSGGVTCHDAVCRRLV